MKNILAKTAFTLAAAFLTAQNAMAANIEVYSDSESALAGTRFPVYVSVKGEDNAIDTSAAAGQRYELSTTPSNELLIFPTKDSDAMLQLPYSGTISSSGIDTLWAEFPLQAVVKAKENFSISVGNSNLDVSIYTPMLTFAEVATKDKDGVPLTWTPVDHDPDTHDDGSPYFQQTGTEVALALIAIDPRTSALCRECNFDVALDANTSVGLSMEEDEVKLENGIAIIRFRSEKDYVEEFATLGVSYIGSTMVSAHYGNLHFKNEPSALPQTSMLSTQPMPTTYTVMDLQGKILRKGITHNADINMSTFAPGSYVVRIGSNYRRINVR